MIISELLHKNKNILSVDFCKTFGDINYQDLLFIVDPYNEIFMKRVAAFRERANSGEDVVPELLSMLKVWLSSHIKGDDRDYVEAVKKVVGDEGINDHIEAWGYGFSNAILTCMEFATGKVMWRQLQEQESEKAKAGA